MCLVVFEVYLNFLTSTIYCIDLFGANSHLVQSRLK